MQPLNSRSTKKRGEIGPSVSIITPAYNAQRYLAETVDSVLTQSFSNFELLIVDDGSTDGTRSLGARLAKQDSRIHLIATTNRGPATARNTAMAAARGEFLALLDSDDIWRPDYLASQLDVFDRHPDASIVTANAVNRGGGGRYDRKPFWRETKGLQRLTARDLLEREDAISILSMFRRRVYETIGGFDSAFTGNEDYEFWLRAALAGFVIIQHRRPLGVYRRHDDSLSADEPRMIRGILEVLRHVEPLVVDRPAERAAIDRQRRRFAEELPAAELRDSLRRSDAAAAARLLQSLSSTRGGWLLPAAARVGAVWPQSLLWAYKLRRAVRA